MRAVLLVIGFFLLSVFAGTLWYYIPQSEVVRITGVETPQRTETVTTGGQSVTVSESIREIHAVKQGDGGVIVFENTDAPWYLKFDSADLHAEASNMQSTSADPSWVVVRYYGWRITYLSWFPNAISIREADEGEQTGWPWIKITLIVIAVMGVLVVWRFLLILFSRFTDRLTGEA